MCAPPYTLSGGCERDFLRTSEMRCTFVFMGCAAAVPISCRVGRASGETRAALLCQRSPFHDFGRLCASVALVPSRRASVTYTSGRCDTSSMSSAAMVPLPFPMRGHMAMDTDCGGSRVGLHSCPTTWGTPCALKVNCRRSVGVCGSDNRVSLSHGVSLCRSAQPWHWYTCCISRGGVLH